MLTRGAGAGAGAGSGSGTGTEVPGETGSAEVAGVALGAINSRRRRFDGVDSVEDSEVSPFAGSSSVSRVRFAPRGDCEPLDWSASVVVTGKAGMTTIRGQIIRSNRKLMGHT